MSQIDGLGGVRYNRTTGSDDGKSVATPRQIIPAGNPLQAEIQEIRAESLMETMESMSLVMGTRLRQNQSKKGADTESNSRLQELLMRWVPKVEGRMLVELAARFPMLGTEGDPIAQMRQGGVPDGAMVLLLASLLGDPRLEHKRRKRLEDALSKLLEDESLGIDIFSWLELGELKKDELLPLRQLYQRTKRDDEESPQGMVAWFSEVREWPDRCQRLKVLIRAMALDLKPDSGNQPAKIVTAINELKRLLLFFSMEDLCASVAYSVAIPEEEMLAEVLLLLEQSWIYPDWIQARMKRLNIDGERTFIWLRRMMELLRFIPSPCFQDDEQCGQLLEAFEQLQEQYEENDE